MPMKYLRGSIWWANLGEDAEGCEQLKTRPVIIVQNDVGNHFSPTVIVAAITDSTNRYMPTHIPVSRASVPGLKKDSCVLAEQIRTIDKRRLIDYIGMLPTPQLPHLDYAMGVSVGLIRAPKPKTKQLETDKEVKP